MTFAMKLQDAQRIARKEERADIILKLAQKFPAEEIATMLEEPLGYIQAVISKREN